MNQEEMTMPALHILTPAPPERVVPISTLAPGSPFMFVCPDGRLGIRIDFLAADQAEWGMNDTLTWYNCDRPGVLGGGTPHDRHVVAIRPDEIPALEAEYEARRHEWENAEPTLVQRADGRWAITLNI